MFLRPRVEFLVREQANPEFPIAWQSRHSLGMWERSRFKSLFQIRMNRDLNLGLSHMPSEVPNYWLFCGGALSFHEKS